MLSGSGVFDVIAQALDGSPDAPVAVVLVRVPRFHDLCGSLGYATTDLLAGAVVDRLQGVLRPDDRLVAIGDCDAAVVLPRLRGDNHAALAAQRMLREFDAPFEIGSRLVKLEAHAGYALSPAHGVDPEALCQAAERALSQARAAGVGYAASSDSEDEASLREDLGQALAENRLHVHFQPVFDLHPQRIMGVEALARWQCPKRGNVSPGRFITLAEQTGLAGELTRWSLHAALREHARLRVVDPGIRCSINLSSKAFPQTGLVEQVLDAIALWGAPVETVLVEVTETAMMENPHHAASVLQRLGDAGVGIAIDDFGRGYSSLAYLRDFPATELKIDQSFVFDMAEQPRSARLVRSMVDLAHQLGMAVVAEGVESAAALELLRAMGCERAQGFHLARPMAPEQLIERLGAGGG